MLYRVSSVKNCEGSEVLSYLQANKLTCQFHECWQKRPLIRDRGLYYAQLSPQHEFYIHVGCPCPVSPRGDVEWPW